MKKLATTPYAWEDEDGNFVVWGTHDAKFGAGELLKELERQGYDAMEDPEQFKYDFLQGARCRWTYNTPNDETWDETYAYANRQPGTVPYLVWTP